MRLFSYVVKRDYGFAPNPFYGVCTLATCKPKIRRVASVGDWIVGTGSKDGGSKDKLVYVMRVAGSISFCEYYADEEFQRKKPNLGQGLKQAFGDNIYNKDDNGNWIQQNSHHSWEDGTTNCNNLEKDTGVDRVLFGEEFAYWGASGPSISPEFLEYRSSLLDSDKNCDIRAVRNHKSCFSQDMINSFVRWFRCTNQTGYLGEPSEWDRIVKSSSCNQLKFT